MPGITEDGLVEPVDIIGCLIGIIILMANESILKVVCKSPLCTNRVISFFRKKISNLGSNGNLITVDIHRIISVVTGAMIGNTAFLAIAHPLCRKLSFHTGFVIMIIPPIRKSNQTSFRHIHKIVTVSVVL